MSRTWWNSLLTSPLILGTALVVSDSVLCGFVPYAAIALNGQREAIAQRAAPKAIAREANLPQRGSALSQEVMATETPEVISVNSYQLSVTRRSVGNIDLQPTSIQNPKSISEAAHSRSVAQGVSAIQNRTDSVQAAKSRIGTPSQVLADNSPASVPIPTDASVLEQVEFYTNEPNENSTESLEQVTNVSELRDVSPGDWAFEALRSLVERYGCIAGYPDGTYRGNRAMSRYEFAAGLNACLQQIERLISSRGENVARREDLATLQRLIEEFGSELASLRGRVDGLEARTTELELTQFSTTTKLEGEAIFGFAGIITGDNIFGEPADDVWILGNRTRLNLETSFTGRDSLETRLEANGLETFTPRTQTFEGNLEFAEEDANNAVEIEALTYTFPVGSSTEIVIAANGGEVDDFASTVNFLDGDGASGALTRFGTRNPIYYLVEGTGIGLRQQLGNTLELSLGYFADDASNPGDGGGLFKGPYGAMAQLVYKPSDRFQIGFTYINSYNRETLTGSSLANPRTLLQTIGGLPVSTGDVPLPPANFTGNLGDLLAQPDFAGFPLGYDLNIPIISNSFGLELSWQVSNNVVLGGWVGYTNTSTLSSGNGLFNRGNIETINGALTLAFPDLGKRGNLAGIIVGVEPTVLSSDIEINPTLANPTSITNPALIPAALALLNSSPRLRQLINIFENPDPDVSLHVEAFYQMRLSDNISVTPGIIWITAPGSIGSNADLVIGTIRTTFSF